MFMRQLSVAALRARQVNDENKIEFNAMLNTIPSSGSDDEAEDVTNPIQLKMAMDFEKETKAASSSFKRITCWRN
ncbi:MAG: hypothetical protein MZV64_39045 [Ignavibacteriales bacterium]|nr:hypothetical protein [Ignavibacteriales bacterium]